MSDNNQKPPPDTLVISLKRQPWAINIGGTLTEIELVINVLEQATRFFKDQRFFAAVAEQERMQAEQQRLQSLGDLRVTRQ